mmetsp:Transcript_17711/g.35540  ORF Transcript_17711/g.35540 Transcript_17711/m.35540 type:complete len:279 (-) Transcript_17711:358-1194(-)
MLRMRMMILIRMNSLHPVPQCATGIQTSVKGFRGEATSCPNVTLGIPTVTSTGEPVRIDIPGPSILDEGAHGLLFAHGPMQRAARCAAAARPLPPSPNPFHLLADDDSDPTPKSRACQWTEQDLKTSHEAWCHPGHTKYDHIVCTHPEHFPRDPAFRAAARKFRCPVCDPTRSLRCRRLLRRKERQRCALPIENIAVSDLHRIRRAVRDCQRMISWLWLWTASTSCGRRRHGAASLRRRSSTSSCDSPTSRSTKYAWTTLGNSQSQRVSCDGAPTEAS